MKYLWNPHPSSWVTKVAYSFRVLAFLLILPVLILTLLVRIQPFMARNIIAYPVIKPFFHARISHPM
jgi:hypothetical protein